MRAFQAAGFAAVLAVSAVGRAETLPLTYDESRFESPERKPVAGPFPREIMFLICVDRDRTSGDDHASTRFCVFDPAAPQEGFRERFSAPSGDQYFRFVTPLFNEWGVAIGSLDMDSKPENGREAFWLNPFTGERGPTLLSDPRREWTGGTELRLMKSGVLHRFDLASGILRKARFRLDDLLLRGPDRVLATSNSLVSLDSPEHKVVELRLDRSEAEVLASDLPEFHGAAEWGEVPLRPAGNDGVYYVYGMALFWHPKGGSWHTVIRDVEIIKTFGGRSPWLPATYVGNGRFAVARSIPKSEVRRRNRPSTALAVTMLIDGNTGRIIEETSPERYDGNPPCTVPEHWWCERYVAEMEQEKKARACSSGLFDFDRASQTVTCGEGKRFPVTEDHEMSLSQDGRTLAIYREFSPESDTAPKLDFTLLDGKDGSVRTVSLTGKREQIFVRSFAWLPLYSSEILPDAMDRFRAARPDLFYDLWR